MERNNSIQSNLVTTNHIKTKFLYNYIKVLRKNMHTFFYVYMYTELLNQRYMYTSVDIKFKN